MNTEKIKLKFIIPAILLILPVVLFLIFDPAVWLSKSNLVSDILGMILFVDVPIGMCLWHWFKPEHFRERRWMIPFGLMTLIFIVILVLLVIINVRKERQMKKLNSVK